MIETKTIVLAVVLALIAAAILYLEASKPPSYGGPALRPEPGSGSPYPLAPELQGISGYINADSDLTLASLQGGAR